MSYKSIILSDSQIRQIRRDLLFASTMQKRLSPCRVSLLRTLTNTLKNKKGR